VNLWDKKIFDVLASYNINGGSMNIECGEKKTMVVINADDINKWFFIY
jgi:hypothetical protein